MFSAWLLSGKLKENVAVQREIFLGGVALVALQNTSRDFERTSVATVPKFNALYL